MYVAEFNEHTQRGQWGVPFSDLPTLKAHYSERVALLYRILSNRFIAHYIIGYELLVNNYLL